MIAKNKKFKKDGDLQNIVFSVFLVILFFSVIGFLIISNYNINKKRSEMLAKIDILQKELRDLEEKNKNLQTGIITAGTDAYQEEKLREQGYQKPGEENIVVLPSESGNATTTEKPKNFFQKLLEKIGY